MLIVSDRGRDKTLYLKSVFPSKMTTPLWKRSHVQEYLDRKKIVLEGICILTWEELELGLKMIMYKTQSSQTTNLKVNNNN